MQRLSLRQPDPEPATWGLGPFPMPSRERASSRPGNMETRTGVAAGCIVRLNCDTTAEGLKRGWRGAGVE